MCIKLLLMKEGATDHWPISRNVWQVTVWKHIIKHIWEDGYHMNTLTSSPWHGSCLKGHRKALSIQSIGGASQWLAPPMLCLLRAFRRPWLFSLLDNKIRQIISLHIYKLHVLFNSQVKYNTWRFLNSPPGPVCLNLQQNTALWLARPWPQCWTA